PGQAAELLLERPDAVAAGQLVGDPESDVVAVSLVLLAGVTQPRDEPHRRCSVPSARWLLLVLAALLVFLGRRPALGGSRALVASRRRLAARSGSRRRTLRRSRALGGNRTLDQSALGRDGRLGLLLGLRRHAGDQGERLGDGGDDARRHLEIR